MMTHNPEMFIQQHRNTQRILEVRDRRGELRTRDEVQRFAVRTKANHIGFGSRIAITIGGILISFGQRLKELGATNSPSTVRMQ